MESSWRTAGVLFSILIIFGCGRQQVNSYNMKITSPVFGHNQLIPPLYTCDGANASPPLIFQGVPSEAKSLVLIVDDPDAPRGDWVHWLLWNISPATTEIVAGKAPVGAIEGNTDFGRPGYGGPCPPSGIHHYHFKLFALDTMLDLPASTKKADLEAAMATHILEQASLIGVYKRK